jgi:hypothetical protein
MTDCSFVEIVVHEIKANAPRACRLHRAALVVVVVVVVVVTIYHLCLRDNCICLRHAVTAVLFIEPFEHAGGRGCCCGEMIFGSQ